MIHFAPVVKVTTPAQPQLQEGLIPSFSNDPADMAANAVATQPVGGQVQVRWVDRKRMADRMDLFGMAHAVGLSLFAVLLALAGAF